jgi:hypothetical protein
MLCRHRDRIGADLGDPPDHHDAQGGREVLARFTDRSRFEHHRALAQPNARRNLGPAHHLVYVFLRHPKPGRDTNSENPGQENARSLPASGLSYILLLCHPLYPFKLFLIYETGP